jgi:alpha-beta hydrolase superfamily lysophospholipase
MNDEMAHIVSRTEDTTFITGSGVRLSARYFLPPESRRRDAGIVFCHGFGGVKEVTPPGLADRLAQYGYTVLTFDYRGFGASAAISSQRSRSRTRSPQSSSWPGATTSTLAGSAFMATASAVVSRCSQRAVILGRVPPS